MKRALSITFAAVVLTSLVACQGTESTVTGSFGNERVAGQVTLVDDLAGQSAEGIEVNAVGTGVSTRTDASGNFTLIGLASDRVTLSLSRGNEINASIEVAPSASSFFQIDVSKTRATKGRRRGVGHPGVEVEGTIKSFAAGKLVVNDARSGGEVEIVVNDATIIRKGHTKLTTEDLKEGVRVHVKVSVAADGTKTAVEIMVQNDGGNGDQGGTTMTASGVVESVGSDHLTVKTADNRTIRVNVDANTQIKRRGQPFALADIKAGDRVEAMGTRVDDTTLLAKKIETQAKSGRK